MPSLGTLRSAVMFAGIGLAAAWAGTARADEDAANTDAPPPKIQLAILLDTSNSMDGLIHQARAQLWKIINELATARRDGQPPEIEVALYEYGKSTLPREEGFLRQTVPLTDDLDKISEELFALTTRGGEEYCGWVISDAVRNLAWSESDDDLKLIFIAGNEPFSQGPVDYKEACAAAIAKGITVNTIHCGPEAQGVSGGWRHGAQLADGSFMNIDQDRQVAAIRTPFDDDLEKLGAEINRTYVAFGLAGVRQEFETRQRRQDRLVREAADAAPGAAAAPAERAAFKASGRYRATAWDLIDGIAAGRVKLEELKDEELPDELRKLNLEERKAYLKKKETERAEIQEEIRKLNDQRKAYIAEERRKQGQADPDDTLDAAVIQSVRKQAAARKFEFEE